MKRAALLVVDVQSDFCPGGALAVEGGDAVMPLVNLLLPRFATVIATQDWHPAGHASFASSHPGRRPLEVIDLSGIGQVLWPDHCVQGTPGAELHASLERTRFRAIIRKGLDPNVDSYSAFRDNRRDHPTGLAGLLRELGIGHVVIVGLTTDYCAATSARDAVEMGFSAEIWLPARPHGAHSRRAARDRRHPPRRHPRLRRHGYRLQAAGGTTAAGVARKKQVEAIIPAVQPRLA